MVEPSLTIAIAGLVLVSAVNLSIALFGYWTAVRHLERMVKIESPDRSSLFSRQVTPRADQPLTAEDLDQIDEWEEK